MSEFSVFLESKRYAVVTGANKGIGFEICRQLASHGVTVILTARHPTKGLEALQSLTTGTNQGLSDFLLFHQLNVTDSRSVADLADFVKSKFGKLDILVNNAAISGVQVDTEALEARIAAGINIFEGTVTQPYELAEACINTNYYGVKSMIQAFLPFLQLSDSPRIVNVSSSMGKLKNVKNEWAKSILHNAEDLTQEKVDEVVNVFLQDFKDHLLAEKGWPPTLPAYIVSKAALNGYTRVLAKKYPAIRINCVCPGYVKTDMNHNMGILSVEEGAESLVRLALIPSLPSGVFFSRKEVSSYE